MLPAGGKTSPRSQRRRPERPGEAAEHSLRRGETYRWTVAATDSGETQSKTFSFKLAVFIGPKQTVIAHSDCWKYGYLKHGWEKRQWFATTPQGAWAGYDLDKGWYRTFQRLMRLREMGRRDDVRRRRQSRPSLLGLLGRPVPHVRHPLAVARRIRV